MKALLILWLSVISASAASVTLAWDRNSEPDVVAYKVYHGPISRIYTNAVNAGNTLSVTLSNLPVHSFVAVTAVNSNGQESDYSDELQTFRTVTLTLQGSSAPTGLWTNEGVCSFDVPLSMSRFYRGVVAIP